jgi:cystathionine beta-lyase/cystathionine gamma-synthase
VATASGAAALTAAISIFDSGVHVIVCQDCYGGTARILDLLQQQKKLTYTPVDLNDEVALSAALRPESKVLWAESPTNPLLNIIDLRRVCDFAREHGLISVVDNTFMTPLLQNPIALGADIVVHSTTKYINGHADVIGGAVVVRDAALADKMRFTVKALGAIAGPFDAWLVLRGSKTLGLRLERQQESAARIAPLLAQDGRIERVFFPGLATHPGHAVAARQQRGFGAVITVKMRGGVAAAKRFAGATKLFALTDSLGGLESQINHSAFMSHAGMPKEQRARAGITDDLVRISVGIEAVDDLIADLKQALD